MTLKASIKCDWRIHDQCFRYWGKLDEDSDSDAMDNIRDEAHWGEGWEVTRQGRDACAPCAHELSIGQKPLDVFLSRDEVEEYFAPVVDG